MTDPARRERRYPPTPYPVGSPETEAYRVAYDLGWSHYASLRAQVLAHEAGLAPGPRKRGYRDGVTARYLYEQRCAEAERAAKARDQEKQKAEWAAEAKSEPPW